jgi:N-acyl-D-aspartate/D-glutamate deacylase
VGADADIVVFDPASIEDKATFRMSTAPSVGVRYVLVAGTMVVDKGEVVENVRPGRPIMADIPAE